MKILNKIFTVVKTFCTKVLELVRKDELPKPPVVKKEEDIFDDFCEKLSKFETELSTGSVMTIGKNILAKKYIDNGNSLKTVSTIFKVSDTTIRRHQKLLTSKLSELFHMLQEEYPELSTETISCYMSKYYCVNLRVNEDGFVYFM